MHRIVVDEKKWVDEARFLHALNFCMLLPGPEATKARDLSGLAAAWRARRVGRRHPVRAAGRLRDAGLEPALRARPRRLADRRRVVRHQGRRAGDRDRGARSASASARSKHRCCSSLAAAAFVGIFFLALPFPLIVAAAALVGYLVARAGAGAARPRRPRPKASPTAGKNRWRHFAIASVVGLAGLVGAGRARGAACSDRSMCWSASACFSPSSRW